MITAKQIRELLEAKPFTPFRICMSDDSRYDITNHDMAPLRSLSCLLFHLK